MVFPANRRRHVPIRPEEHMTPPIHDNEQIPGHMADLPTDRPPHPFVRRVVRVKVELGICEAIDLLAEPAIKFLVIGPDDYLRVRMHTVSSLGRAENSGVQHSQYYSANSSSALSNF